MSEYIIFTDSCCDIKPELLQQWGVPYANMTFSFDGEDKEYIGTDISNHDFYDRMRQGAHARTAAINADTFARAFTPILEEGKDILYICFSSALSGSYQTSLLAANDITEKYPEAKIKVIDSISACSGEGYLVHHCVKKRNEGASLDELAQYAEKIKHRVIHLFTVNDLNHLHRGGRLSKLSAVVGGMLGIKPVLYFDDTGHLLPYTKIRGRRQSLEAMAKQMKEKYVPGENEEIFISDADAREEAEYLGEYIKKLMPDVKTIRYGKIGAVIGTHAGPETVALFFIGKDREPVDIK